MSESKIKTCTLLTHNFSRNRSTLFKEALLSAKHGKVLYILRDELNELPELSQDLTLVSRQYMKMISFLYAKTLDSLIETVSLLPEWQNVPRLIILDDLSQYCDQNNIQNACGIIALLMDATARCSSALNMPCNLCISISRENIGDDYCNVIEDLYSNAF